MAARHASFQNVDPVPVTVAPPFMHKASRCHVNPGASQQYYGFRDLHVIMCSFWSRLHACRPHYGSMEQENAALGVLVHALDLHL